MGRGLCERQEAGSGGRPGTGGGGCPDPHVRSHTLAPTLPAARAPLPVRLRAGRPSSPPPARAALPGAPRRLRPRPRVAGPATCSCPQLAPRTPRWAGRSCGFRPHLLSRSLPGLWLRLPPQEKGNGWLCPVLQDSPPGPSCCCCCCCWWRGWGDPGRPGAVCSCCSLTCTQTLPAPRRPWCALHPPLAPFGHAVPVSTRPSPLLPGYIISSRRVLVSTPQTPPWNGAGRGRRVGDLDRFRLAAGWDTGIPQAGGRSPPRPQHGTQCPRFPGSCPPTRDLAHEREKGTVSPRGVSGLLSEIWVGRSGLAAERKESQKPRVWRIELVWDGAGSEGGERARQDAWVPSGFPLRVSRSPKAASLRIPKGSIAGGPPPPCRGQRSVLEVAWGDVTRARAQGGLPGNEVSSPFHSSHLRPESSSRPAPSLSLLPSLGPSILQVGNPGLEFCEGEGHSCGVARRLCPSAGSLCPRLARQISGAGLQRPGKRLLAVSLTFPPAAPPHVLLCCPWPYIELK